MKSYRVIISTNLSPKPTPYEISAAYILADYFQCDVEFVLRGMKKTADYLISKQYWELKSPTGHGKRTVQRTLQRAIKQSTNIVFDARRSKIHINKLKYELYYQVNLIHSIKRLILIDKSENVIVIK